MPQGVEEPHKPATRRRIPRKPDMGQERGPERNPNPDRGPAPPAVAPPVTHRPAPSGTGLRLDDLYRLPMPKLLRHRHLLRSHQRLHPRLHLLLKPRLPLSVRLLRLPPSRRNQLLSTSFRWATCTSRCSAASTTP